jgi:hypothetical protein
MLSLRGGTETRGTSFALRALFVFGSGLTRKLVLPIGQGYNAPTSSDRSVSRQTLWERWSIINNASNYLGGSVHQPCQT